MVTWQQIGQGEPNPFDVTHTNNSTYRASYGEFVITEGSQVDLPTPQANAAVAIRSFEQQVTITTPSGNIRDSSTTGNVHFSSARYIIFVSDGTNWYVQNNESGISSTIPDSVVNRLLLDEGSGTELSDDVGSANGTLNNGGEWSDSSDFGEGTAPLFDGSEDGVWQPRATTPIMWTMRVKADNLRNGNNWMMGHTVTPGLLYDGANDAWRGVSEGGVDVLTVAESQSSVEGSVRILALRLDSADFKLDVYQADATTKVGSDSVSNPNTTFDDTTNYFGNRESAFSDGWSGNIDGPFDVHDSVPSDAELDDIIANVYG